MKLFIEDNPKEVLFEMAGVRGKTVKTPKRLPFSFFFSTKDAVESKDSNHGLRVKPVFNPEKINYNELGTLKLHGDWKYTPGINDGDVNGKEIRKMKEFFKYYKILFAAVWEKALPHDIVEDYFRGHATFDEVVQEFYFYNDYEDKIKHFNGTGIKTFDDIHDFVAENNLFNTWDK